MEDDRGNIHLTSFEFGGQRLSIEFIETTEVTDGVECDIYKFVGDNTKDLGIIRIDANCKTPLQKVLKGDRTTEGFVSGAGKLIVSKNGEDSIYKVKDGDSLSVNVEIGETMQWMADENRSLKVYEICFPPYEDGRYENLLSN